MKTLKASGTLIVLAIALTGCNDSQPEATPPSPFFYSPPPGAFTPIPTPPSKDSPAYWCQDYRPTWLEDASRLLAETFPVTERTPANVKRGMVDGPLWEKYQAIQSDFKLIGASPGLFIEWGEYVFTQNPKDPVKVARQTIIDCG